MRIRAGIGCSKSLNDAFVAGSEAANAAITDLAGETPSLIIVFTTPRYDLSALIKGIRSITCTTPLIGATGAGQMVQGGVSVLALTAGPYRFGLASVADIKGKLDQAGQLIARESKAEAGPSPHAAILLLVDSLAGDLQQIVQGVYRITGPKVAITGGAAGDELKFERTSIVMDPWPKKRYCCGKSIIG